MKGVSQVPDFLDEIAAILEYESDFTDRDPVYLIDPSGSEFGIEMVGTFPPVPPISVEPPGNVSLARDPRAFLRSVIKRELAPRLNRLIDQINDSIGHRTGALAESLRRLARSHRALERKVSALAQEQHSPRGHAADRITALEQKVRLLELNLVAVEDALSEIEAALGKSAQARGNERD